MKFKTLFRIFNCPYFGEHEKYINQQLTTVNTNTVPVHTQPSEDEGDHLPGWPGLQLLPVLLAALVRPQRGHGDGEEPGAGDSGDSGGA